MNPTAKKWIEAGTILAQDPSAVVRCPERNDGILRVHDEMAPDGERMERYLICDACGARGILLMQAPDHVK
jgi:hypothetical protein